MNINIWAFLILIFFTLLSITRFSNGIHQNANNDQLQRIFQQWKRQFSISFSDYENAYRFKIFTQNLHQIQKHNQISNRTYSLGINQFAHLTQNQFVSIFLTQTQIDSYTIKNSQKDKSFMNLGNLTDVDWQTLGKVSEIKNQGNCDAGYAFSTTSLIQTSLLMQNQNILLSEQQIIDCAANYQSLGCNGGSRIGAIKFAQEKGLATQKDYPYNSSKGTCRLQKGSFKADFSVVESIGCDQIKQNLYKSPMTLDVNAKTWQLYSNGVFNNCPSTSQVNHQIYLVGVTLTYWRLKNSWGSRWGQNGYIRVKLGNNCGICQRPAYGFVL